MVHSFPTRRSSDLVLPERTLAWPVATLAEATLASLAPVIDAEPKVELLLLGCGGRAQSPMSELRRALRAKGIVLELMDTGAACRTYNFLAAEERRVAAALIAMR